MSVVVLDSGPLAQLVHSKELPESIACKEWARALWENGHSVVVPEIADYEVRRELVRMGQRKSLFRLDSLPLQSGVDYLPLNTGLMRLAAQLWADARAKGRPTADPQALDADVILAASVRQLERDAPLVRFIVASTNARHLDQFVRTARWEQIDPVRPIP